MSLWQHIRKILTPGSRAAPQSKDEVALQWQRRLTENGVFTYNEDGFVMAFEHTSQKIKWSEIERIRAYKADLLTIDEIRMDICWDGGGCTITEEIPGWYQFVERTKKVFSVIPEYWDNDIIQPPFATNSMTLYEREDRVLPMYTNFYASFLGVDKYQVKEAFKKQGWSVREIDLKTGFELGNSWSELRVFDDHEGAILNGEVAFHLDNIALIDQLLDGLDWAYQYEFYDANNNLLLEKRP